MLEDSPHSVCRVDHRAEVTDDECVEERPAYDHSRRKPAAEAPVQFVPFMSQSSMHGLVAEELRMCGWGPHTREASVWEACCWHSGDINMSWTVSCFGVLCG